MGDSLAHLDRYFGRRFWPLRVESNLDRQEDQEYTTVHHDMLHGIRCICQRVYSLVFLDSRNLVCILETHPDRNASWADSYFVGLLFFTPP